MVLRIEKTVTNVTARYVRSGSNIVLEISCTNEVEYIRGINFIAVDDGTTRSYYLFNGHGDVVSLTDTTGSSIKTYDYDAFGIEKSPSSTDTNPFRYCGEYFDKETKTIYLRARYYNPQTGRFISQDSYTGKQTDPLSLNLYTYCGNNPVIFIDPSGNHAKWISYIPIFGWGYTLGEAIYHTFDPYEEDGSRFDANEWSDRMWESTAVTLSFGYGLYCMGFTGAESSLQEAWDVTSNFFTNTWNDIKTGWNLTFNKGTYSDYAIQATKNTKSGEVLLGKFNEVGRSYNKVARDRGATYFNLDNWSEVESMLGRENMWNINKEFLNQQWDTGKEFYFSHNPWEADGYFGQEVEHLINLGVKDFVEVGDNLWKAIR